METQGITAYRIYGKDKSMKRFSPLNLAQGKFVGNLIYATLIYSKESADKALAHLIEENPEFEFKLKTAHNS